jgi:hypothetical protein
MNKKKVNEIRHVVELRENVMMNENKSHMKCLSAGGRYDRHTQKKKKSFKFSCFYITIYFFFHRCHYHLRRVMLSINRQFLKKKLIESTCYLFTYTEILDYLLYREIILKMSLSTHIYLYDVLFLV